jgi:phosphohistidine phosphatase
MCEGVFMDLYLIRHADAAPTGPNGEDGPRPLTELGHTQARALAAALVKMKVSFGAIITSPLIRARETTDELLGVFSDPKPPVSVFDEIGFEVRPAKIVKFLKKQPGQIVAIVGHQPGLSRFAAWMIGSKKAQLDLEKAGYAKIVCDEWKKGEGKLVELVSPVWYS